MEVKIMETKKCSKCGVEKPLELFSIKRKKSTTGRRSHCKACVKEQYDNDPKVIALREIRELAVKDVPEGCKKCTQCSEILDFSEFYDDPRWGDGKVSSCKKCRSKYAAGYYSMNSDSVKRRVSNWKKSNYVASVIGNRDYKDRNRERLRVDAIRYYMENRESVIDRIRHSDPNKVAARKAVSYAVKCGKLIKPSHCEECEDPNVEGHHHMGYDEENWLNVRWLCRKHHKEEHRIDLTKLALVAS